MSCRFVALCIADQAQVVTAAVVVTVAEVVVAEVEDMAVGVVDMVVEGEEVVVMVEWEGGEMGSTVTQGAR